MLEIKSKACCACHIEKPVSEFSPDKKHKTGLRSRCKACQNELNRSRRTAEMMREESRARRARNPMEGTIANRKYRASHPGLMTQKTREYKEMHPEKRKAHQLTWTAIRAGVLQKHPCAFCGDSNAEAHHEDYAKPLEVTWLCKKHHAERHAAIRALGD